MPLKSLRRFIGVAIVLVAILALWWVVRHRAQPADSVAATRASALPESSNAWSRIVADAAVPQVVPPPASQASAPSDAACRALAPTFAKAASAPGGDSLEALRGDPALQPIQAGVQRIDAALRASADPFANAVAVWLNVPRGADAGAVAEDERQRRLAVLASSTTDPRVYSLAFGACRGTGESACRLLTARRWAALDPGNGLPWSFLLNDAVRNGDVSGQQEALFQMAQATRFDERSTTALQPILAAAGDDPTDQAGARWLAIGAIGAAAARPLPVGQLMTACRAPRLSDANQSQLCLKIGNLLFDQADTLYSRRAGATIIARITGDNSRSAQAGTEVLAAARQNMKTPTGCGELRGQLTLLRRMATLGMVGAAQAAQRDATH